MDKDEKKEFFLSVYRHSLAHVMAKAVMEIFGKENVQITIGPQIADGAYYDFELPRTVTQDDFKTIEDKMREIIKRREDWTRKEVSKEEALEMFKDQRFKVELINDLPEDDKIVYFLHHSETDSDGREKVKTIGKMLDEKLTVEGCFDIVLYCQDHKFYTQGNGQSTAKSPEGLFELEIPNDLKAVDERIREYWNLGGDADA
jgi:threonyl-tRNA synthetase